ncbi:unnamed protein product [Vicia faba]|uniref:Secreted protein n=1 Tax=Vicia faba TaxID=3906 RepID=A0AAV0YT21_VICFA|nr:unnamed protein product [Vicia faba]
MVFVMPSLAFCRTVARHIRMAFFFTIKAVSGLEANCELVLSFVLFPTNGIYNALTWNDSRKFVKLFFGSLCQELVPSISLFILLNESLSRSSSSQSARVPFSCYSSVKSDAAMVLIEFSFKDSRTALSLHLSILNISTALLRHQDCGGRRIDFYDENLTRITFNRRSYRRRWREEEDDWNFGLGCTVHP